MSDPRRMLIWMVLFVAVIGGVAALLYRPLQTAFEANVAFNGMIIATLLVGLVIDFAQVVGVGPAMRWLDQTSRGFETPNPPRIVAPLARVVQGREKEGFTLSTLAMRSLLEGVRMRLDESRDIARYFVGLLIFLGLLGTFWGLLQTIGAVGKVIGSLPAEGGDVARVFADLKANLQTPLAGMGTAFSSSLFGLAGALALGVLDLQAGHAQNVFFSELEEFLSGRARLPSRLNSGGSEETTLPSYIEALLEQTAENLSELQRMMARSEDERRSMHAGLAKLTDRLTELSDQLRVEQKVMTNLLTGRNPRPGA